MLDSVVDNPNLLPVELSGDLRRVHWLDVGDCPFDHSIFEWSLQSWDPGFRNRPTVETDLAPLAAEAFALDAIEPTVFVFHLSRCGSSLLARALAQSPRVVVMSEVPVLNQALEGMSQRDFDAGIEGAERLRVLRNLILGLGRRRAPEQQYYAVKFSSWNALLLRSVRAAFPRTRCLFLYREPGEVAVSLLSRPPGWVESQGSVWAERLTGLSRAALDGLGRAEYVAAHLGRLMSAGARPEAGALLDYADLERGTFAALLRAFGIDGTGEETAAMTAQFDFHAKTFERDARFSDDTAAKREAITPEIQRAVSDPLAASFSALASSSRNLRGILRPSGEGRVRAD